MKKIIIMSLVVINSLITYAQNNKSSNQATIALATYVPEQIEGMPASARSVLENKLNQIVTANGISGSPWNTRFIITANVVVISKDLTATAPPMQALTLDVTLNIGDGIEGTKFSSHNVQLKGVGENETKAYLAALKNLKTNDPAYQSFIEKGKTKIVEYYNSKCDQIIKEAQSLVSQNKYEEALYKLTGVPEECKDCYAKCMETAKPIYKKAIDKECKLKLAEATNLWNANQNYEVASQVGGMLVSIDPEAACYGEVKALMNKIAARVKELDTREWNYTLKEQAQESERINAIRDIGVAYGKGQPKTVSYNVSRW